MHKRSILILAVIELLFSFGAQAYSVFSNGALIKGSGPEVYVIEYGVKRWIPNPETFKNLFYDAGRIKKVTDDALKSFPNGRKIDNDFSDGALIKSDKSPKVYLYDNGSLRWIANPFIFNSNNFSWENIIIVSDSMLGAKSKGIDVKTAEFSVLPASFITIKPPAEINLTKVTFSYSGVNPTGPVSELTWETFLDGYDASWQWPSSSYTRAINLPGVNKAYTFYVRSKNKDGKTDSHPASYSFRIVGFSPNYAQLKINYVKGGGNTELDEYARIANYSAASVNITGLIVKNRKNEIFYMPKGNEFLTLGNSDFLKDIILEPNKNAIVSSGFSPVGKNYRLNKCTGYLNSFYNLSSKFPEECPKPTDQDLVAFGKSCRDYINALPPCAPPNVADLRVTFDDQCRNYLTSTFNYSSCVARYQYDPDFLKNDWYIFLNRSSGFWDDSHDEARLLDKGGSLMDSYSY